MKSFTRKLVMVSALAVGAGAVVAQDAPATPPPMGFFITSVGLGDGGNLGGLEGADAHCQSLAAAVGAGDRTWRAYLSTQATDQQPAVNARDRIGNGPWHNSRGFMIAADLDLLHYDNSAINHTHALTEKATAVASRAMNNLPNQHDILTGSTLDGRAIAGDADATCSNWTSNDAGAAMVGHHDRYRFETLGSPWNAAHLSRGCSEEALLATGGAGQFYCFAAD